MRGELAFPASGAFTIVQFNDTQDSHTTDVRTTELQNAVLDDAKPDFVVINGDVIDGGPKTVTEVKQAINNVVLPMERGRFPGRSRSATTTRTARARRASTRPT